MTIAQMPAFCFDCNHFFPSGFPAGGIIIDCKSVCPKCKKIALVLNGFHGFVDGTLNSTLFGKDFKKLNQVQDLLRKYINDKKANPVKVFEELDSLVPNIEEITKFFPKDKTTILCWLQALLLIIIAFIKSCDSDSEINTTTIINQIINSEVTINQDVDN